jgi:GNAT superfamily N-acetyltransferase
MPPQSLIAWRPWPIATFEKSPVQNPWNTAAKVASVRLGRADHLPGSRMRGRCSSVSGPFRADGIGAALGHKLPCLTGMIFRTRVAIFVQVYVIGPMIGALTYLIRIARPSDSDAVGALLAASYSSLLTARYDSDTLGRALPVMSRANPALLRSGTYYVAERAPCNLVGCGGWTTARPGSGEIFEGEAHIRHFATHPEWVGRGVGTSLLARCFNDARILGIRKLHCFSTLNAERFYRASRFETIGPVDVPMGPSLTFPGILMSRELA